MYSWRRFVDGWLRDALLPKLLNGEIRVREAPQVEDTCDKANYSQ